MALAGLVAMTGAVIVTGAGTTVAPAAVAAAASCGATPSSGYRQSTIATGLDTPRGIDVDAAGVVYVGGSGASPEVVRLIPNGTDYDQEPVDGTSAPHGLAVGNDGAVYLTDADQGTVRKLTPSGGGYVEGDVVAGLDQPKAVAVDPSGVVFVGDAANQRVIKLTPSGGGYVSSAVQSGPVGAVDGLTVQGSTLLLTTADTVRALNIPGGVVGSVIPSTGLSSAGGLDVDGSGDVGAIVVADAGNDRIVRLAVESTAYVQSLISTSGLEAPEDVAVDADGNIFVADTGNDRVVRLTPVSVDAEADTASTTAGAAVTTDVADNDTATGVTLADPTIAKDPAHGTATVNDNGTITYTPDAGFSGTDSYRYAVRDGGDPAVVCDVATVTVTVGQDNSCGTTGTTGGLTRSLIPSGIDYPRHLVEDADGALLVPDPDTDELVRIVPSGVGGTRTVVATGLDNPGDIAIDDAGVLYVLSWSSSSVTRLTPSGPGWTSTVIASGGLLEGVSGIAVGPDGDLFVTAGASTGDQGRVLRLAADSGYSPETIATGLYYVDDVAVDSEGVVYATTATGVIELVDTGSGWTQSDVLTGGQEGFGITVDDEGAVWVGDPDGDGLLRLTRADDGWTESPNPAWDGGSPTSIVVTEGGVVFGLDGYDEIIRMGPAFLEATDDVAAVEAGGALTIDVRANDVTNAALAAPSLVSAPANGAVVVQPDGTMTYTPTPSWTGTDTFRYEIRDAGSQVCSVGTVRVTVTSAGGCPTLASTADAFRIEGTHDLAEPTGIAVDANRIIYISDVGQQRVIGWGPGSGPAWIDGRDGLDPQGIAVDADRNVYYADEDEHEIVKMTWSEDDGYTRSVLATSLQRPSGVAVDAGGRVFFAENSSGHVHVLTPSGEDYTSSLVTSGLDRPRGLAIDGDGNLYVADSTNDRIVQLTPTGSGWTTSTVSTSVDDPTGVAVDPSGAVIVGDTGNNRVLRLTPSPTGHTQSTITIWGDHTPTWVAAFEGAVLVVDHDTGEVVIIGSAGINAVDDTAGSTPVGTPVTTDVRDNDTTSPEGGALDLPSVVDAPDGGSTTVNDDGTITYTPDAGFSGADSYRYEVRDDQDPATVCDAATVRVIVQNVFSGEGQASTPYNTPVTLALADIVTTTGKPLDPARTTLARAAGDGGVVIDAATGDVTYTPDAGFSGEDTFAIQVCDTSEPVQCHEAEVRVTVAARSGPSSTPRIVTKAAERVALRVASTGRPASVRLSDRVTISGFVPGGASTGRATLYGPVPKVTSATCTPARAVRTVTFTPRNGTFQTPSVPVNRPGRYTWVVSTGADENNLAATHACGLAAETTLVHRPAVGNLAVEAGYSGTTRGRLRAQPASIAVPAIGMKAPITAVGARRGTMLIPASMTRGGWYAGSAAPGEAIGSTVIAGHVSDRRDRPGVFGKLRRARVGQVVTVRAVDGTVQRYRITSVRSQSRSRGISGAAVSTTGSHRLTLVTCTGKVTYRNGRFHYTKNLVVTAVPIP
ncbi:hypothetical protein ASE01_05390 [Nocardioides sp. Root190]|nr:hypothetical protein ASE01_05390 [Nocardioides sp. Root190]